MLNRKSFTDLDNWIERKLALDGTPGLSLVITDREQTLYTGSYGLANIDAKTPVSPAHVFEIGSIGKSFTALVLLRMQARGLIDLHAPVTDYLPWFAVKSEYEPITIHHLLTHSAGIHSGSDMAADGRFEAWQLRESEVLGPPGTHFSYSNVGYKTLGYIIEDLLGCGYGEVVTEEVLNPLGMTESFSPITSAQRHRLAVAYRWPYRDRPRRESDRLVPDTWIETSTADGSIASTPRDMAIYARFHLNRAEGLISEDDFELMISGLAPESGQQPGETYGYGMMTWNADGRRLLGHGGGMVGYYSSLTLDPDSGIGVATMINGPGEPDEVATVALAYARAVATGDTPELPDLRSPLEIENAGDYAGVYTGEGGRWAIMADGASLVVEHEGRRTPLERRGKDSFFADDPQVDRDLIGFERKDDAVVALHHGAAWFGRVGIEHDTPPEAPAHWAAYLGAYQCHNPWLPGFRIFERRGRLCLAVFPGRSIPLAERSEGLLQFDLGDTPSASYLRFDAVAGGMALRVDFKGQMYYRTPESSVKPRSSSAGREWNVAELTERTGEMERVVV